MQDKYGLSPFWQMNMPSSTQEERVSQFLRSVWAMTEGIKERMFAEDARQKDRNKFHYTTDILHAQDNAVLDAVRRGTVFRPDRTFSTAASYMKSRVMEKAEAWKQSTRDYTT